MYMRMASVLKPKMHEPLVSIPQASVVDAILKQRLVPCFDIADDRVHEAIVYGF